VGIVYEIGKGGILSLSDFPAKGIRLKMLVTVGAAASAQPFAHRLSLRKIGNEKSVLQNQLRPLHRCQNLRSKRFPILIGGLAGA
jgi:hypothetical protein